MGSPGFKFPLSQLGGSSLNYCKGVLWENNGGNMLWATLRNRGIFKKFFNGVIEKEKVVSIKDRISDVPFLISDAGKLVPEFPTPHQTNKYV